MHRFTEHNITAFTSLDVPSLVAHFDEDDSAFDEAFIEAAEILQNTEGLVFGKTTSLPSQICKFQGIGKIFTYCYFSYVTNALDVDVSALLEN